MPYPGYAGWVVQLDPEAVATNRVMLDINNPDVSGISIGGASGDSGGIDWGQSAITEFVSQQGQYGNSVADFIIPNRTVTVPIGLGMSSSPDAPDPETALRNLSMKVGLWQRQGGWLLRQRLDGDPLYADVVDAQLDVPDDWMETAGVEPSVTLTLTCLPDFYGDEIELDTMHCTGFCTGVLTLDGEQAVIAGDYPARCRMLLTDTSGNQQNSLVWGVQSRYYNPAVTQALAYPATALTAINGASEASNAAAYGGEVVKVEPSAAATWWPFLALELSSSKLAHQGSYRVLVRAMSATTTPSLLLSWGNADSSVQTTNTAVALPAVDEFCLLDLGVVRLDATPVGASAWIGTIAAQVSTADDDVQVDMVWLVPLDDAAGSLSALSSSGSSVIMAAGVAADAASSGSGAAWEYSDGTWTTELTGESQLLVFTGFGLAVPSGATVVGVTAAVLRYAGTSGREVQDQTVNLYSAGATIGNNQAVPGPWETFPTTVSYGSSHNIWGASLTPAVVNSSGFGLALAVVGVSTDAYVIAANSTGPTLTVYYTLGSFALAADAVIYADETLQLTDKGAYRTADGTVYAQASTPIGDLTRIPPSGLEDQPCRFFAKPTRNQWTNGSGVDSAIDSFTVTPYISPCYLSRI